jgi:hypothetical protein
LLDVLKVLRIKKVSPVEHGPLEAVILTNFVLYLPEIDFSSVEDRSDSVPLRPTDFNRSSREVGADTSTAFISV